MSVAEEAKMARERLDLESIDKAASRAAFELSAVGFALVEFSPGDATTYQVVVADRGFKLDRYLLGSNFGPLYPIPGHFQVDPGYAQTKYLDRRYANTHTGVVYAEFIAALGRHLTEGS